MTEEISPEMQELLTGEDLIPEDPGPYHSILQVWHAVLAPAAVERMSKVAPQWANRIVSTYRGIDFADMEMFKEEYFDLILELTRILDEEISQDDECLKVTSAEEDVEQNQAHYLNVLFTWQKAIMQHELEWDCLSPRAAIQIGVLSEVHKMFFEKTGLTALLDQINFEFTDSDRDLLASQLAELKTPKEG